MGLYEDSWALEGFYTNEVSPSEKALRKRSTMIRTCKANEKVRLRFRGGKALPDHDEDL